MHEISATVEEYDVIILGAGINGCGTFRDLCAQGVRCLMIERDDYCAGASAASSRLMHGGLKYLETGEFRLVRESLYERNMLLTTAAHLVLPLECLVPVRSHFGGVIGSVARFLRIKATIRDRGTLITKLGLALYDLYGRKLRRMPAHRMLSRRGIDREMPQLGPDIIAVGVYFEGQITHAERLGLELALDGEALNPSSRSVTHAEILGCDGGVLRWRDRDGEHLSRAKVIINAGGAWIDAVNHRLGIETRLMGGSRGSHLVIDHPELFAELDGCMVYFGTADGRVNLIYPFADKILVGSTDIAQDDPDLAECSETEETYLREAVREVFPNLIVKPSHVMYRFCGVRPLPRADGTEDIGLVTRDHSIARLNLPNSSTPVLCLIGGKWTTFRAFSAQATDEALKFLGQSRRISTAGMAIGGARDFPLSEAGRAELTQELAQRFGLPKQRIEALIARYGSRVREYLDHLSGPETPLADCPEYSVEEIAHICRTERVQTVDDVLRRRTLISLRGMSTDEVRQAVSAILDRIMQDGHKRAVFNG
ncbi:glycerol-3-phosphate dehydrogenase/oxidase [Paracoccus versutus]|uniref:Glycerol-3-phosphate dehydrogenase n=1 Tax=Paracoccus versutus TaxID=34007 RepID=A0A3D9XY88_PARVE|nr:glycerol-3-phosphate dehydrogenase/oxidase [Paracoccus versutus]REF73232.1 glycerol-3-phosphate dehydrogenase [Paracoccus versutus]WGR54871.1 glycerol-3-phosphate dehydrogenase/oxidase [Paracoccus versutus]